MKNLRHYLLLITVLYLITNGLIFGSTNQTIGTIFPYLQSPTPTSIYICWQNNYSTDSQVLYGNSSALGNTIVGSYEEMSDGNVNVIWHTVKLTDLTPNTVYYYKCVSGTGESDIFKLKTSPVTGSNNGHIRFAVVGDNRTVPVMFRTVIEAMKEKMIELYGEDIESNIDAVLDVGDIITSGGSLNQYKNEYFDPINPLSANVPFMVSIGNHENEDPYFYQHMKYEDFKGEEGEKYYSFKIGRVFFIAINSNWQLRNETQMIWLEEILGKAQYNSSIDWIFAFCHHPGRSEVWPDGNTAYIQDRVIPLLAQYSKAEFLLYGHSHNYERGAITDGNLRLMLNGGAGSALDRWRGYGNQTNYPEIQKSYDHYCYSIFDINIAARSYTCKTFSLGHPDKSLNNIKIDSFYRKQVGSTAPNKPEAITNNQSIKYRFVLEASPYSGAEPLASSQFQITTNSGSYNNPVIDIKRDFEDIYYDTGAPNYEPVDLNKDIDLKKISLTSTYLPRTGAYYWRIRYRDRNLQWSEWSDEQSINVIEGGYESILGHNKSLTFDGTSSYIEITNDLNSAVLPKKEMTVETWAKLNTNNVWGGFIGAFQDNGNYEKGWVLGNYDKKFSFALASQGNGRIRYLKSDEDFEFEKWYHVAGTYDGAIMKIYVNGRLKNTITEQQGDINYDMSSYFDIGAYHDDDEFNVLDGELDEIRLWDVALDESMIQDWMFKEINDVHPLYSKLISNWSFNEISGGRLVDLTDTNEGVINNMDIFNRLVSTAPVGLYGKFVEYDNTTSVGLDGTQLQVSVTYAPADLDYLGIYLTGENDGTSIDHEIFPGNVNRRSNVVWGMKDYGEVTVDVEFHYGNIQGIPGSDSLVLLYRYDANSDWMDMSGEFDHYSEDKMFEYVDLIDFGEYALGWQGEATGIKYAFKTDVPNHYVLSQNYPNPFNSTTSIKYSVKRAGNVKIEIFNMSGQKIKTLIDEETEAGNFSIHWDASNISSGIYFYKMQVGPYEKIKKSLLIK
jgi:hypothetical protein